MSTSADSPTSTSSPITNPVSAPSQRLRWVAGASRLLLWLVATFWLLFALGWVALHGWIVPRIAEYRPRLEAVASKAVGVPIRIGHITARSEGLIPSFELTDVTLLDAEGRVALRLPKLTAAISPASLWSLGFEQLYIEKPELDIRRAADGKLFVGGLDMTRDENKNSGAGADWFFSQTEFVIRGGTVRWTDELRGAPPLALTDVDAVVRNGRLRHLMRVDATPPPDWGDRFTLRGIFRQGLLTRRAGDFAEWNGQLYADFTRVDAAQLKHYLPLQSMGVALNQGRGALRAWADVGDGQVTGGTADVSLTNVQGRLGAQLEPLAFDEVAGRFKGGQRQRGYDFTTEGLQFRTAEGLVWPGGNVALVHTDADSRNPASTELNADRLDLAALAQIAHRLPLDATVHTMLDANAPTGLVETLTARWTGPADALLSYHAKGRVTGLGVASVPADPAFVTVPLAGGGITTHPRPGRPGISGAAVDFDLTQDGGSAKIRIVNGAMDFPGVFDEERVPFDHLSADARWKTTGHKIEASLRNLQFANSDTAGEAQISWHTEEPDHAGVVPGTPGDHRFPGVLDLQGTLSRGNGARVHRYLPLVLPDTARHYVRDAVVVGEVSDVRFKVKGPVREIPFGSPTNQADGDFRVSAKVKKGTFAYVPKSIQPVGAATWPAITELDGELVFSRSSLDINGVTGKVMGLPGLQVVKADARIADLSHNATVEVNANLSGALADALAYVNTSPVSAITSHALAGATGTGNADYRFKLSLPIHEIDKSRVDGTVTLPGNDVQFTAATPAFGKLKGVVGITEHGFTVSGAQGRLLGGDVRFDGGMAPLTAAARAAGETTGVIAFKAQGTVTADGLRQAKDLGLAARLAHNATGSASYTAAIGFKRGTPEVSVSSTLQGMALDFPTPLTKSADSSLPIRFDSALLPGAGTAGQPLHDQISLSIGKLAAITYVRDLSGSDVRVLRGAIGVGLEGLESMPLPESGVSANINVAKVDVDAWEKILAEEPGATTPAFTSVTGNALASSTQSYLPTTLAIRAKELVVQGRQLNNVVVGGSRDGQNWRANIDASELNGYVEFRQGGAGRVYARLSRLVLAPAAASDVEALIDEQPASIPALDIVVEDMELRGKKLGRIEIEAVNRGAFGPASGGVREWRLNKLNVILPEATLTATGNWVAVKAQSPAGSARPFRALGAVAERRRTVMNFKLDIADSGELLRRFGMAGVIRRGKGRLEGQVGWIGSPLALDYPSLNGQFNVDVDSGQFIKADPGLAKLLGVLSLQALPRRLALDFRDVFSEGFAFDFIRGDVNINEGLAATNNLQMRGVNAAVMMEGNADIARETQNLKVVVIPQIDAGTASLIATAINPVIGLSTFLAQMFLRKPLMEAATQEFHIDGTWSDPKITRLSRRTGAPEVPATDTK